MQNNPVSTWHYLLQHQMQGLDDFLAEDVVFHSPVVHTPQAGKTITSQYLIAAHHVFNNDSFTYRQEIIGHQTAVLEFNLEIDGSKINGVDMLQWNAAGKITEFKVMIRPLKGLNIIHEKMKEMLEQQMKTTKRQN